MKGIHQSLVDSSPEVASNVENIICHDTISYREITSANHKFSME